MHNCLKGEAKQARAAFIATAVIGLALATGPAASSASPRVGGAGLPSDLERAWDDYNQATIRKDIGKLAALVTDDYMLVNSDSSVQDKKSYLADFEAPGFKLDPYKVEQPVRRMWENSGLTGGVFDLTWTQDGRHQERRLRFVHVWTRKDGRWRIAYTQLTRTPQVSEGH
jgi:ketosteroid isomerase-like protein